MQKLKNLKNAVFAVPLRNGGYGIGLVTHQNKDILLGRFFNLRYDTIPVSIDKSMLKKELIVYVKLFSSLGIKKGEWPILSFVEFDNDEWPIPAFKSKNVLTEDYYLVTYNENLEESSRKKSNEDSMKDLFDDGLAGYGFIEIKLTDILQRQH